MYWWIYLNSCLQLLWKPGFDLGWHINAQAFSLLHACCRQFCTCCMFPDTPTPGFYNVLRNNWIICTMWPYFKVHKRWVLAVLVEQCRMISTNNVFCLKPSYLYYLSVGTPHVSRGQQHQQFKIISLKYVICNNKVTGIFYEVPFWHEKGCGGTSEVTIKITSVLLDHDDIC